MTYKSNKWTLPQEEVSCGGGAATVTNRRKLTKNSRALDLRELDLCLRHEPTGIEVEGTVAKGNYSKKQMQIERDKLYSQLWLELERKVAKYLKIPGM